MGIGRSPSNRVGSDRICDVYSTRVECGAEDRPQPPSCPERCKIATCARGGARGMRIERRSFLKLGAAAIPTVPVSAFAQAPNREPDESTRVKFTSDGLAFTPREHAR